jgi:hypothetical protein
MFSHQAELRLQRRLPHRKMLVFSLWNIGWLRENVGSGSESFKPVDTLWLLAHETRLLRAEPYRYITNAFARTARPSIEQRFTIVTDFAGQNMIFGKRCARAALAWA